MKGVYIKFKFKQVIINEPCGTVATLTYKFISAHEFFLRVTNKKLREKELKFFQLFSYERNLYNIQVQISCL